MVKITYPPPTRNINPQIIKLQPRTTIQRIFDPNRYGTTATKFRYYGPLSRFDHQRGTLPTVDQERGIIYAGFSLSCCLVEVFGDLGIIDVRQQQVARITFKQTVKLLDLRKSGAWDVGATASMVTDGRRKLTQAWSRYFYDYPNLYEKIEGLIFNNAHNGEDAIALYERAIAKIELAEVSILNLNDPALRESLLAIASKLNLLVEIN